MRSLIFGLLSYGLMISSVFADELVSYDHNLYVTRTMVAPSRAELHSKKLNTASSQNLPQKRSLHAQKYTRHDNKPYLLGYHEGRQQKMLTTIRRTARDRS